MVGIEAMKDVTEYKQGDELKLDDLVVKAIYKGFEAKEVTDYVTNVSEIDMNSEGIKTLKISYSKGGMIKNAEIEIKVNKNDTASVDEPIPEEKKTIQLSLSSVTLKPGETKLIAITGTGVGKCTLMTSNPDVVKFVKRDASTPDSSIKIIAISAGTAVITATSDSDSSVKATCVVKVIASPNTNIRRNTSVKPPVKAKIKTTKNKAKKKLSIKWRFQVDADGFQVEIATNKAFTKGRKVKTINSYLKTESIFKKLKKKTYYVRVRAFANSSQGKVYGAWSKVKKVKIKN